MNQLERLANTLEFEQSDQSQRAEMLVWLLENSPGSQDVSLADVASSFELLKLPRPNTTRLKERFRKSRNIRSSRAGRYQVVRAFADTMRTILPDNATVADDVLDVEKIELPPFVSSDRMTDLKKMVHAYARLFLLENSMRGLIEAILTDKLGDDWWDKASNRSMRKKHEDRLNNEKSKKWAPARTDFGPLYALDWPDLITIMRKYPDYFESRIADINFLHRYEDAGSFRNVVAHNGVLRENDDFELIRIYYRNWIKQVS